MVSGLQKISLVDYPEYPSFVIFLGGCNMRCPFCHNKSVVEKHQEIPLDEVFGYLEERLRLINAVVVSGGEPTIHGKNLIALLERIRQYPVKIKLDTNGTNPDLLKELIDLKLVDYIAMDIKNSFAKYDEACGAPIDISKIKKSIKLIEKSGLEYEFRTTVNKDMHSREDIIEIRSYIKDLSKFTIQPYRFNDNQLTNTDFGELNAEECQRIESAGINLRN